MTRAAFVGFVLLVSTAALAVADNSGIVDPFAKQQPSRSDSASRKRAAELSAQSAQHYKRGEFEIAAALLKQAYALYPEPNLLYNLARSLEGMGDKAGAVDAYQRYLDAGKQIEDRGAIERRIATLKADLAVQQRAQQPGADSQAAQHPPDDVSRPAQQVPAASDEVAQPVDRVTPPSKLPWIPIIGGIAVIGGGIGVGLTAKSLEQQAIDEPNALAAKDLHDSARRDAMIANVMFAVGGAALVSGIVWEVFVLRAQSNKTDLPRPVVTTRGLALEWTLP